MIPEPWAAFFKSEFERAQQSNLLRRLRVMRHQTGARVVIGSRELVNFASNDYLGLTADLRITESAARAAGRYGWGVGASRLVSGTSPLHHELETETARFRRTEASILFGSGYQANLGVISALASKDDVIFSDQLNHESIIAACRLSRAEVKVFPHRDYDELEKLLKKSKSGRRLVVSDSLFSLDGDAADLRRLADLAEKHEALLVVDDAHANAVLGSHGRGLAELQGVEDRVLVQTGTYSKALGSYGGFVACPREIREYLVNASRPFTFTTALPIALIAANIEALRIVRKEGAQLRQKLSGLVQMLRTKLQAAEFELLGEHHILSIVIGDADRALAYGDTLEKHGMLVYPFRWPAALQDRSLLRISVTAAHTDDDIYRLVNALKAARDKTRGKGTTKIIRRKTLRPGELKMNTVGPDDDPSGAPSLQAEPDSPGLDDAPELAAESADVDPRELFQPSRGFTGSDPTKLVKRPNDVGKVMPPRPATGRSKSPPL